MNNHFNLFKTKMEAETLPNIAIDNFKFYYHSLLEGKTGMLSESEIDNIDSLPEYEQIASKYFEHGKKVSTQVVNIKLNGGLGTGMGLSDAKSLLKIKDDYTFLDIIAMQSIESKIQLLLMNSFNTQKKSLEVLNKHTKLRQKLPFDFLQSKIPKINSENFKPAEYKENKNLEWCPPGHGEIYTAMVTSGLLDQLISNNIKYAFISNSDNLGAVMDYGILGYFAKNNIPFLMEVANRTEADKKGGHLAKLKNGELVLRESAQCPEEDLENFQNIEKHKYFNTNNIWINLLELKSLMERTNNILKLPMIVNKKTINPKDSESKKVIQLETAMGSAISVFNNAKALQVPRIRFAPVKTTDDLLGVRSDNFILTDDFKVVQNPKRNLPPIIINLDKKFYKLVEDLDLRIPNVPSLVECKSLKIIGDNKFGKGIKIIGDAIISNSSGKTNVINDNEIIIGT